MGRGHRHGDGGPKHAASSTASMSTGLLFRGDHFHAVTADRSLFLPALYTICWPTNASRGG